MTFFGIDSVSHIFKKYKIECFVILAIAILTIVPTYIELQKEKKKKKNNTPNVGSDFSSDFIPTQVNFKNNEQKPKEINKTINIENTTPVEILNEGDRTKTQKETIQVLAHTEIGRAEKNDLKNFIKCTTPKTKRQYTQSATDIYQATLNYNKMLHDNGFKTYSIKKPVAWYTKHKKVYRDVDLNTFKTSFRDCIWIREYYGENAPKMKENPNKYSFNIDKVTEIEINKQGIPEITVTSEYYQHIKTTHMRPPRAEYPEFN